tara:strand:+ start:86 stop:208 length:123 start_codon:yes stop_codon:yes gene_type:complete
MNPHSGLYKFATIVETINIIKPDIAKSLTGKSLVLMELII